MVDQEGAVIASISMLLSAVIIVAQIVLIRRLGKALTRSFKCFNEMHAAFKDMEAVNAKNVQTINGLMDLVAQQNRRAV